MDQANPKLADGQKIPSSSDRPAIQGLPQESPLSPVLFNIYVWDLPKFHCVDGLSVFQFANDTAIVAMAKKPKRNHQQVKKMARGDKEENNGLSLKARMTILKSIALPMANYRQEIWVKGSPKAIQRMQEIQLILAGKCSGVPWFTRNSELTKKLRLEDVEKAALERRQDAIDSMKNHPAKSYESLHVKNNIDTLPTLLPLIQQGLPYMDSHVISFFGTMRVAKIFGAALYLE
ncbi:hypothetical protein Trydic_g16309 [Trypoxylus dichotomus]